MRAPLSLSLRSMQRRLTETFPNTFHLYQSPITPCSYRHAVVTVLYFTGSDHFNRSMRMWAGRNGMKLNEKELVGRIRPRRNDKASEVILSAVEVLTEEDVFKVGRSVWCVLVRCVCLCVSPCAHVEWVCMCVCVVGGGFRPVAPPSRPFTVLFSFVSRPHGSYTHTRTHTLSHTHTFTLSLTHTHSHPSSS